MFMTRVLTWAALSIATAALGQRLPPSPCPSMFQYQPDGPQWTGLIRVNSPSLVSNLRLNIKMSIGARLPSRYVGRLELLGEQAEIIQQVLSGGVLRYRVHFPLISPLPRLTAIFLNGDLLCQGPPERGGYVTTINLDHALSTGTQIASLNRPTGGFTRPGDFVFGQDGVFNQQGGVYNQGGLFDQQGGVYGQDGDIIIEQLYPVTQPSQARPPVTENSKPKNPYQDNNPIVFDVNAGVGTYNNETVELKPIGNGQYMVVYNSRPNPDSFARPIIVDTKEDNKVDEKPVTPGPDANRPCGVSKQKAVPLIVGGESTSRGEWPWLAAIFVKKVSSLDYVCGGSIVSSKHIITAAHCVHSKGNRVVKVTEILVKVGAFNLQDWTDEYARTVAVSDVVLYPDFVATQILNTDISILVLAKTLTFSDYVIPVCLWDEDVDLARVVGQKATVVGWGRDENGLRATPEPRRAAITIVSTETCRLSRQDFQYLTNEKTLCAGDRDGSGPCNGDSGGGLFLYRGGRWMLRGVVSNSLPDPNSTNTCNLHEYVIFTDTAKYLAWIHKVMAE